MAQHVAGAALLCAGVIHLLPVIGVAGGARLEALYGLPMADVNMRVLMRHRAVLFGLLGAPLTAAAFLPAWQPAAIAAGTVSAGSFLVLAAVEGAPLNARLARVARADGVALAALALAALALRLA